MTGRISKTHDLVGVHNRLQTMCDCQEGHILAKLCAQRCLDDRVRLVVC